MRWKDDRLKVDYLFPSIDIQLHAADNKRRFLMAATLPEELGSSVVISADLAGTVKAWTESDIQFYLHGKDLHLHEISSHFKQDKVPWPADLSVETWGTMEKGAVTRLLGDLSFSGLEELKESSLQPYCYSEDYIRSANLKFDWRTHGEGWKLQLGDVQVVTHKQTWPQSSLVFIRENREGTEHLFSSASYLETGALCNSFSSIPGMQARLKSYLQELNLRAEFTQAELFVDQAEDASVHYGLHVDSVLLDARDQNTGQSIQGLSGSLAAGDLGGSFAVGDQMVAVTWPKAYGNDPLSASITGTIDWQQNDGRWQLDSQQLRISNQDIDVLGRFSLQWLHEGPYLDLQTVVTRSELPTVARYFPRLEHTTKTKNWLEQGLVSGKVKVATALLRGDLLGFPFDKHPGVFTVDASADNGVIRYLNDWPLLEQVE
ncbi:MAG: hypothetical protein KDA77_20495, partial [Planctomycetaceae bacterium]|nr:hypothetical protein [Planctomycetaceae bacterium]